MAKCGCIKAIELSTPKVDELQIFECGFIYKESNSIYYFVESYSCVPREATNVEFVHRLLQSQYR